MKERKFTGWLAKFASALIRHIAEVDQLGDRMVELDILRRERDREIGRLYAENRNRLIEELDAIGMSEKQFCAALGKGNSLSTMLRRMRLVPDAAWDRYLTQRRQRADGVYNLEYAVYLATERSSRRSPSHSATAPAPF